MWWRRLAEVQTEHQNGEERGFKWLWTWNVCWCQTGWSEYFKNCLVPIEHRLNATAYPSIVAYHVHPFMTTVHPSSDGYFQQDNAPCYKIVSDWFLKHDNEFTLLKWPPVTRPLSNRAPLACGGTGDLHHGCAADKSAATAWCYHVNMDKNLWGMFPAPCWIYAMKN